MNAKRALLLFAAYAGTMLAVDVLIGVVVAMHYRQAGGGIEELHAAMLLGSAFGIVVAGACVFWLARRMLRGDPDGLRTVGWMRTTPRNQALAAVAGLALGLFYAVVVTRLFPLGPKVQLGPVVVDAISGGGWKLYAWIVLALFIAPPIEEFVFRGVLWTGFARSLGPIAAAIVVTALFVLMHVLESGRYPPALFAIATLGLACIGARVLTRSLAAPIAMHMAYNAVIATGTLREFG